MTRPALTVLAAVALLASCGVVEGSGPPPTGTTSSSPDGPARLAELQDRSIDALVEASTALEATGLVPYFASFDYQRCDRPVPTFSGEAFGRFDTASGGPATKADATAARAALSELGWAPVDRDRWVDGLWTSARRWHLAMSRDGLGLSMAFFRGGPEVLFKISGECVEVPADVEDSFSIDFHPIDLDDLVGATGRDEAAAPASSTPPST